MNNQATFDESLRQIKSIVGEKRSCIWDLFCPFCGKKISNTTCPPEVLIKMVFNELDRRKCDEGLGFHGFIVMESGKEIGCFDHYEFQAFKEEVD